MIVLSPPLSPLSFFSVVLTVARAWRCAHPSPDIVAPWTCRGIYCASRWRPGNRNPSSHRSADDASSRAAVVFWGTFAARSSHRWDWAAAVPHRWCAAAVPDSRPASVPDAVHTCRDSGNGCADPSERVARHRLQWWPARGERKRERGRVVRQVAGTRVKPTSRVASSCACHMPHATWPQCMQIEKWCRQVVFLQPTLEGGVREVEGAWHAACGKWNWKAIFVGRQMNFSFCCCCPRAPLAFDNPYVAVSVSVFASAAVCVSSLDLHAAYCHWQLLFLFLLSNEAKQIPQTAAGQAVA